MKNIRLAPMPYTIADFHANLVKFGPLATYHFYNVLSIHMSIFNCPRKVPFYKYGLAFEYWNFAKSIKIQYSL